MMNDFFNIDGSLSEEERAVRESVRRFVDERVLPIIGKCYVEGRFPKELIPVMGELGVFGANLPEAYGCTGLNNVAYGLIMQELERGDSGVRSFASVQGALAMYPIYAFGSEEQKRRYLPKMATGEIIGCFGLTEPDFGSNPAGMITTAREGSDGSYVLNGSKMWITNGSTAHIAIVWAKTGTDERSIRGFIVPTDSTGFTAKDQKGKLSLRASDTSELVMQDVCVSGSQLLPQSGGLKSPLMCLTQARYGISWGALGVAIRHGNGEIFMGHGERLGDRGGLLRRTREGFDDGGKIGAGVGEEIIDAALGKRAQAGVGRGRPIALVRCHLAPCSAAAGRGLAVLPRALL